MVQPNGLRYHSFVGIIVFAVIVCGHIRHEKKRSERYFLKKGVALGLFYEVKDHGPWGPWSESSECSRTCGGGVAFQTRSCSNITIGIVNNCVGPHKRYFSCNIQDCPEGSRDFREEQCSAFDSIPFDGKLYQWIPYKKGTNICELNCMPKGERFYYRHSRVVLDGTRCQDDASHICVEGVCTPTGCDMMLGSDVKDDNCRECGGNNANCKTIGGIFNTTYLQMGYNDIILIPSGAMNIKIEELEPTSNYIAVRNFAGQYYLNGNWKIEFPRHLEFVGTTFHYERVPSGHLCVESISALGPTTEPIFISLLYQQKNPGISYEYSIPKISNSFKPESYSWVSSAFRSCSRTCSGGIQYRTVNCTMTHGSKVVADHLCDPALKPSENQACNTQPCPARWNITDWDQCTKTCEKGTQYRQVYCQQHVDQHTIVVVHDIKCLENDGPRPPYVQTCNDMPCPVWFTSQWSPCDQMCGEGHQTRELNCQVQIQGMTKVIDISLCDESKMPLSSQTCFMRPCEGMEWIVSEWSGCDTVCGPALESRSIFCASENGSIHSSDLCSGKKSPELTRTCSSLPKCESMWHASEWSECSAICNSGVRTRHVFCGMRGPDGVRELPETECDPVKKMTDVDQCKKRQCQHNWFTGPWTRCSVPCGGGYHTRRILCLLNDTVAADDHCDATSRPFDKELCNMHACDEDEIIMIGGCHKSKHGCCSDGVTPSGPNFSGCPDYQEENNCRNSEFGCCLDGITAALGPFGKGCQKIRKCEDAKYGCCPDGITSAKGNSQEGCPTQCADTTWGCCPDGQTPASGNNYGGCVIPSSECHFSPYGCCPDDITSASGPDFEGCDIDISSGEDCNYAVFGCCPDGMTPALDQYFKGCLELPIPKNFYSSNCSKNQHGCCPDGITPSLGPDFQGCELFEGSGEPERDCHNTFFGCCQDGITISKGLNFLGCPETVTLFIETVVTTDNPASNQEIEIAMLCNLTVFGCCPDGINHATGSNMAGCVLENNLVHYVCTETEFSCCPDGITAALGPNEYGCCFSSAYGCCPDNRTVAIGEKYLGCGCETFSYGCCLDNKTPAKGPNYYGCTCEHSVYGCCQDNFTSSKGPHYKDCDCHTMLYGCCSDDLTPASGYNNKGCDCLNLRYGCCSDGKTAALGPNHHGCSCATFPFGCCPDGRSIASGPSNEGCPCYSMPFGCCLDYKTTASGPNFEGCSCFTMPNRCCPDNKTTATGSNNEGCPCNTMKYGCCPDNHTSANGPNYQECPCHTMVHKCCPDGKMTAKGPNYDGCPCTSFPFGCCPDGVTVAKDRHLGGCHYQEESITATADVCSMPKERGPCHNYSVKWYFDMTYGGCSRFWYGGCEGNGNQFESQEKCEKICVEPEGEDACLLPKVVGPCKGEYKSWYYNANSDACENFIYSGCLGNNNRFESRELCERTCIFHGFQDPCEKPAFSGPCKKSFQRWYFSKSEKACKPFIYGGCKGNENNFETEKECLQKCSLFKQKYLGKCQLPQKIGSCYYFRERWFFNSNEGKCQRFYFSGCDGNENNFASLSDCEKECHDGDVNEIPSEEFRIEHCLLNYDAGSCNGKITMWFYGKDGVCRQFYYSGCGGNGNRFNSKKECENRCGPSQDICKLPKVRGPCSGSFIQWHYDSHTENCQEFYYSGCQGNMNRFNDKETCALQCKPPPSETETSSFNICLEPKDTGPCLGYFLVWYYDNSENRCKSFVYGGCKGNNNRFGTLNDCLANCHNGGILNIRKGKDLVRASTASPSSFLSNEDVCRQPKDEGQCKDLQNKWYYDSHSGRCHPFTYRGCGGNKNRFKSNELCLRFCAGIQGIPQDDSGEERLPVKAILCPTSNCVHLQCPYGMEDIKDSNGCLSCLCSNPCETHDCPQGTQCAIEDNDKSNGEHYWQPVCRHISKHGKCPSGTLKDHVSEMCHNRCQTDADCPKDLKCCFVACSLVCVSPNVTENYNKRDDQVKPGLTSLLHTLNIRKDVRVKTGSPILLPCILRGDPFPDVKWYQNNELLDSDRTEYKITVDGSLHIISIHQSDAGTYSCVSKDSSGTPVTHIFAVKVYDDLVVNVTLVTEKYKLGSELQLDCVVTSSIPTKITWHLGHNSNPVQSDDHRQILSNNTLYIASAQYNDSGLYICAAENENSDALSSMSINVYDIPIPSSCTDSPNFSSCSLIVKQQYCINPSYAKFCCFSCAISGQLQRVPESAS